MTELLATSSVLMNEVKFNWKIKNFTLMLNPISTSRNQNGIREMSSPEFKIGSNTFWLHITEKLEPCLEERTIVGRNGSCVMNQEDYSIVTIEAKSATEDILAAGTLTIDMVGEKFPYGERRKPWLPPRGVEGDESVSGIFGDPTHNTIQINRDSPILFKNQTAKIEFSLITNENYPKENSAEDGAYFLINRLAASVEIKVHLYFRSPTISIASYESNEDTGRDKLSADMRALYESKERSDFTILCGGQSFPCHELILRVRSSVLNAMFQTEMTETSDRSMVVEDVGPGTVAAVLEYVYTGGITEEAVSMKELIYVADKYDLGGIMEFCFRKLPQVGNDILLDFLFMADKHNFVEYKKAILLRINMDKVKHLEDQAFVEKLKEAPHLLVELYKL